jgi:hypothetical protein
MHIETQSFIAIIEIEMENTGTIIQKALNKKNRMVLFSWFRNLNNAKQYIILMNGDTNLLSVLMAFHGSEMNDVNLIPTTIGILR